MTATATTAKLPRLPHVGRVTLPRLIVSEWTKLRSVRSTVWSLLAAVVFTIGLSALVPAVRMHHLQPGEHIDNPLELTLAGVQIAQLAIGVLGVLVISGEYSTGMIRSTMLAAPKRLPVLWSKLIVYGTTVFALMVPSAFIAFFIAHAIMQPHHQAVSFGAQGVVRALVGAGLYLTVIGLFGLGVGAIVRNTAGGIATFAAVMFVLPPLMNVLPTSWNNAASPYLPLQAGERVLQLQGGTLSPWEGFAVLCGYAAAAIVIAAVLLRRRDV
jgi:ABC-type transport system involved in multi-copper enzyme maturation permease subunit